MGVHEEMRKPCEIGTVYRPILHTRELRYRGTYRCEWHSQSSSAVL